VNAESSLIVILALRFGNFLFKYNTYISSFIKLLGHYMVLNFFNLSVFISGATSTKNNSRTKEIMTLFKAFIMGFS
jgi:hypothetical protein